MALFDTSKNLFGTLAADVMLSRAFIFRRG